MYDFHPVEGRFLTPEDLARSAKVVVLGSTRREQLFGGRPAVGQVISIGADRYTVVGVMERKEFYWNSANRNALEWMNEMMFVPVTSVITRMVGDRENQKVAYINVQVRDVKDMEKATDEVKAILRRAHGGVEDFQVFNRAAFMQQMDEQGKIYDITFLTCGTISLLVGGIVIMNILLASFNERIREVGTRKALGATGLNILAQFLVESVVVTIVGGLLGLGLGVGFTQRDEHAHPAAGGDDRPEHGPRPGVRGDDRHLLRVLPGDPRRPPQPHRSPEVRVTCRSERPPAPPPPRSGATSSARPSPSSASCSARPRSWSWCP